MKQHSIYLISAITAVLFVFTSCEKAPDTDDQTSVVSVIDITLNRSSATMRISDTLTLTALFLPENATNKTVTWSSSNTTVATVNGGMVIAISEGTATVTATAQDGNHITTCNITVNLEGVNASIPVTSVTLNQTTATLQINETLALTATVLPINATNRNVTWTSSNPFIASVFNGIVTAIAQGTATITVTTRDGYHTATCAITVAPSVDDTDSANSLFIVADVVNSNQLGFIRRVRAAVLGGTTEQTIASSNFYSTGSNNFSFTLVDSPDYFMPINLEGLTVNPIGTRAAFADIEAFTSTSGAFNSEHWAGNFWLERWEETDTSYTLAWVEFIYAERDVTITGIIDEVSWSETWNVTLKKGWNRVYVTSVYNHLPYTERIIYSSTPVSGLTWIFYGENPAGAPNNDRFASPAKKRMQERDRRSNRSNLFAR
jgi:hypothetical protein